MCRGRFWREPSATPLYATGPEISPNLSGLLEYDDAQPGSGAGASAPAASRLLRASRALRLAASRGRDALSGITTRAFASLATASLAASARGHRRGSAASLGGEPLAVMVTTGEASTGGAAADAAGAAAEGGIGPLPPRRRVATFNKGEEWASNVTARLRHGGLQSAADGDADVVAFVAAVHAVYHERSFQSASDERRVERMFSFGSPADCLGANFATYGRFVALNLANVAAGPNGKGTLEFRRFHGCIEGPLVATWAHLCVAFVETSRHVDMCARVLDVPLAEGLAALQRAQERATLADLIDRLKGHVSAQAVKALAQDAVGHPARGTRRPTPSAAGAQASHP